MVSCALKQHKTFLFCWAAYSLAYFCRVNFSVALPFINAEFPGEAVKTGVIASCFFFSYAIGQLLNGFAGDLKRPESMVFWGLLLSAGANFIFGFVSNIGLMSGIWFLNGLFQSMLWGPIVRILSVRRESDGINNRSSMLMLSTVAGYFLAWGAAGTLADQLNWRFAMWIPAIVVGLFACIWFFTMIRTAKTDVNPILIKPVKAEGEKIPLTQTLSRARLWFVMPGALCQGIIKDGVSLWVPLYLLHKFNLSLTNTVLFILIIPVFNALGIIFTGWLNSRMLYQERKTAALLFAISFLLLLLLVLMPVRNILPTTLLIACASGMAYGTNSIILSIIPMKCGQYGKSSFVAGIMDCCSYSGVGISSLVLGAFTAAGNVDIIPLSWLLAAISGVVFMLLAHKFTDGRRTEYETDGGLTL